MYRKPTPTEKRKSYPIVSESFVMLPHPHQQQQQAIQRPILTSKSTNTVTTVTTPTHVEFQTTVEEANWTRNNSLSHRLKVANRLFDIMSSQSNVDHPLCQECTDMLLEALEKQLEDVSRERDCYIEFMKKVKDSRLSNEEEQELRKQLEEVIKEKFVYTLTHIQSVASISRRRSFSRITEIAGRGKKA